MALSSQSGHTPTVSRPRLRGWIHAASAPLSLAAGVVLVRRAATVPATVSSLIFTATAVTLFGVSAVYHLGSWSPRARALLRGLDHANILLLVAGTYTPVAVLVLHGACRVAVLAVTWAAAGLGFAFRSHWGTVSRWVSVPVYLSVGWIAVIAVPQLVNGAGLAVLLLLAAGGLLYSAGGVVYGLRRPDPWPRWFGFHEVFHTCTVAAFACQYAAISALASHA